MANMENMGEVFSTDVLVLGAGLSGFIVANRIKELNGKPDVLIVEKSTAGFSGSKANKGAGVMWVMQEDDDFDKFCEYYCKHHGHYLEDQELLGKVCATTRPMVEHRERWGVSIMREEGGKLSRLESVPLWSLCAYDLDIMDRLRKTGVKLGVRMIDKTQSVDLLTWGNRAVGAVGFDLITGVYRIFKARSVVLATGSCNWMVTDMWYSGRGDGIAAAYRAGAEMRNAEFSNFYNLGLRGTGGALVGSQYALYNSHGEYLAPKYCADFEVDIDVGILLGMEKEVMEGKGPIVLEEVAHQAESEVSPANDWHMLGLCIDLKNMTQCADIYYNACLTRTETRGWHYREDFPKRDDRNWRKWIDIKQEGGKMVISTEPLPVERYRTKPDSGDALWEDKRFSVGPAPDLGPEGAAAPILSKRKEIGVPLGDVRRTDLRSDEKEKPYSKYFYRQPEVFSSLSSCFFCLEGWFSPGYPSVDFSLA